MKNKAQLKEANITTKYNMVSWIKSWNRKWTFSSTEIGIQLYSLVNNVPVLTS